MKRCLLLICGVLLLLASDLFAVSGPPLDVSVTATPFSTLLGQSVHIEATVNNNDTKKANIREIDLYAVSFAQCITPNVVELVTASHVTIDSGQTMTYATDFIAPCIDSQWEAEFYLRFGNSGTTTIVALCSFSVN